MKKNPSMPAPIPPEPGPVTECLSQVRLGNPKSHRNIQVWPIFLGIEASLDYQTLDACILDGKAEVTEISEYGSVPELSLVNRSDKLLLIIDGEELLGAKQNRVVNTSLIVEPHTQTTIPVSCTEHGRWSHISKAFRASGTVMEASVRRAKLRQVSGNLRQGKGHQSEQGEVWNDIASLHKKAAHHSPTGAMQDLFLHREQQLKAVLQDLDPEPGQSGLLVTISGRVIGCDILSQAKAYRELHTKLVRSYVLDALLSGDESNQSQPEADPDSTPVTAFLTDACQCQEERFASVGCGTSLRLQGSRVGCAALLHEGTIIHLVMFRSVSDAAQEN